MTTTLKIEIETIIYDEGEPDEETIKEIDCYLVNTTTKSIVYEFSMDATDYPDNASVQAYVESELTLRGLAWGSVEVVNI